VEDERNRVQRELEVEREGRCRRVGVDEQERPPGLEPQRNERDVGHVALRRARCGAQPPVEPVRPGVVGALKRLPATLARGDDGAAMAADIQERAQLAVAVARHDGGDPAGLAGEVRRRLRQAPGVADVVPGRAEDPVALGPEHVRI
jgi:hypothetical protein